MISVTTVFPGAARVTLTVYGDFGDAGEVARVRAEGLDLGVTGYFMTQTTEEKGSPTTTDTTRYRAYSLGPELNWRPASAPGFQVALRSYFEFGARNTSEGVFTVLSFAYVFPSGAKS